ncbi:MAG: T9SS type A sorting domain-containing protein [Bacteroidota bacterium]
MAYRFLPLALLLLALIPAAAAQSLPDIERAAADAGADAVTARALAQAATVALGEDQRLTVSGQRFGFYGASVSLDGTRALVGASGESAGSALSSGAVYVLELVGGTWTQTARLTASDAAEDDRFGFSVSLDGDRALIGAFRDGHGGLTNAGSAYVFDFGGGMWTETQKLTASDAAQDDFYGENVSLDGDRILIGAPVDDHSGLSDAGSVYVLDLMGGTWTETQKITASDAAQDDTFGQSASLDGNRILVGAPLDDRDGLSDLGSAYIFDLTGGTWTETQKITASDAADGDVFGQSVSLDGDRVLIGARFNDHSGLVNPGSAYVLDLIGGTWTETQKITASDAADGDVFGQSVSLDGDRVLISTTEDSHSGSLRVGSAYVFDLTAGVWSETQKIIASNPTDTDFFGVAISLEGDRALIGSFDTHSGLPGAGSAYVFDVFGALWSETQKTTAVSAENTDNFGTSVAMDGNRAIVGSFRRNHSGFTLAGTAHIFELVSGTWVQTAELIASDAASFDFFGSSVSLDGDRALVGAYLAEAGSIPAAGAAYVFDFSGASWNQTQKLTASDAANFDAFGWSVSLDGDRALIGAYDDDHSGGTDAGSAYVFDLSGGAWSETQKLTASDAAGTDRFGFDVSLSGDRVLVSATNDDHSGLTDAGSVYAFHLSAGAWGQTQKLIASDAVDFGAFGWSISLDGSRALLGGFNVVAGGGAYMFDLSAGTWSETQKLTASASGGVFGSSVSLQGNRAVIGDELESRPGLLSAGTAYVFDRAGTTWVETARLTATDASADDRLGRAVAISGDLVLLTTQNDDHSGVTDAGSVYAYTLQPALVGTTLSATGIPGNGSAYRMLAMPSFGTYDDLLDPLWTQGFPGSDDPAPANGFCSAYTFDETLGSFSAGYACLPGSSQPFARGTGVFTYVFADDDLNTPGRQGGFPKTLLVPGPGGLNFGAPFNGFPITYTDSPTVPSYLEGWNLLGNPLSEAFDWDLVTRTGGLSGTIYVYDPAYLGGDYRSWSAGIGGDLPDGVVPAMQGFFAKAFAPSPGLEIDLNAVVTNRVPVYSRSAEPDPLRLALTMGADTVSVAFVAPTDSAALGADDRDAYRLTPTAWPRTVLSTASEVDATPLALNALPLDASGEIALPLTVAAEGHAPGVLDLALSWSGDLPEGWTATLEDTETGTRTPLDPGTRYAFTLDVPAPSARSTSGASASGKQSARPASLGVDLAPPSPQSTEAGRGDEGDPVTTGERFRLLLAPQRSTASEGAGGLVFGLGAPSPNPSRSRTVRVPFTLESPGVARVSVYDALGREVAVLASGAMAAGAHEAMLPGEDLAPGVYVVRLVLGERSAIRRLTVIR